MELERVAHELAVDEVDEELSHSSLVDLLNMCTPIKTLSLYAIDHPSEKPHADGQLESALSASREYGREVSDHVCVYNILADRASLSHWQSPAIAFQILKHSPVVKTLRHLSISQEYALHQRSSGAFSSPMHSRFELHPKQPRSVQFIYTSSPFFPTPPSRFHRRSMCQFRRVRVAQRTPIRTDRAQHHPAVSSPHRTLHASAGAFTRQ